MLIKFGLSDTNHQRGRQKLNLSIIVLEIVLTRAALAFHNLFMDMGCVFDINTVHKTVEKLTFQAGCLEKDNSLCSLAYYGRNEFKSLSSSFLCLLLFAVLFPIFTNLLPISKS